MESCKWFRQDELGPKGMCAHLMECRGCAIRIPEDCEYAVKKREEELVYQLPDVSFWAEEYECGSRYLDDLGVPRADASGNIYSLVGRISRALEDSELSRIAKERAGQNTIKVDIDDL